MASINIASLTLANSQITDLGNHNTGTCSVTSGSASVTFSTALPVGYRGKRGYQISLSGADYFVDDTASNGLSLTLTRSAFLTLPFALFQIFLLRSISLGAKPNWTLLHATSLAVFGLTTYFLTLTFWLR